MDNPSHPIYQQDPFNSETKTHRGKYHDVAIEIKSNHPMTNSHNYSLKVEHDGQRNHSALTAPSKIPNPSPVAKGLDEKK